MILVFCWNKKIVSLLLFLYFTTYFAFGKEIKTLSIGWEPWIPYQFQDKEGKLTGLDIDLITAIAENAGYSLSFAEIPWKRQLEYIKTGDINIVIGASKTIEREVHAYFSYPYRTESVNLYVRKDEANKFQINSLGDIVNFQFVLGVSRGYFYGDTYEELIQNPDFKLHIEEVTNDTFNYKKLLNHRIDGFLADPISFASTIEKENLLEKIEAHSLTIYSTDIFIMFSKKSVSPQIVDDFNKSISEIKKNGTYEKILNKYNIKI